MSADDGPNSMSWEAWLEILPQSLAAMANENRNFPEGPANSGTELAVYGLRPGACLVLGTDRRHAERLYRGLLGFLDDEGIQLLAEGWSNEKDAFALAVAADPETIESRLAGRRLKLPPGEHEMN